MLGFFIITVDALGLNVALPAIRDDLGGGITGLQWVVDGYTLLFAAPLLSAGALSDRIGARQSLGAGLIAVAASDSVDAVRTGTQGLFGSDSVTRQVHGDPEDPQPLSATDPDTGERHPVDEPELLRWVHCAEIDSYLHVLRCSGFPFTDAAADRYIAEHRIAAELVGLDPEEVPGDQEELAAYFVRVLPELAAGPEAREVDDSLRTPPTHPLLAPARALLWRRVANLAYASLPPYAHELYRRRAASPAVVTRRLCLTGTLLRCVPARLRRQLPPKHIIRAMRRLGPGSCPAPYKVVR